MNGRAKYEFTQSIGLDPARPVVAVVARPAALPDTLGMAG
jgi:hypothetical protein